jgi:hypothetical protein
MGEKVQIDLSVESAQAVRAWLANNQGIVMNVDALKSLEKAADAAAKKSADGFKSVEKSVASTADGVLKLTSGLSVLGTAWKGITKLAELYKQELDQIIQRQRQSAEKQVAFAPAFHRAYHAAGGEIPADELYETIVKGANGVNPTDLALTFEAATSAAGKLGKRAVLGSVMQTAKMRPDLDVESRTNLSTGALQLQKEFGGSIEEAMAAVQQSFTTSRAENLATYSKNVVPTIVGLHQMGRGKDSYEDLASLAVGFGQAMNDPTGEKSRTSMIHLFKELKEKGAAAGVVGGDAGIMETLGAVRGNKSLMTTLLGSFAQTEFGESASSLHKKIKEGKLTTEAAAFQASVDLVTGRPDSAMMQELAAARGGIMPVGPEAVAAIKAREAEMAGSKYSMAAGIARAGQQGTNEIELLSSFGSLGTAQQFVARKQMELGVNPVGRQIAEWAMQRASSGYEKASPTPEIGYAELARNTLKVDVDRILAGKGHLGDLSVAASDQENARALLKVIEKLDELIAVQRDVAGKPLQVDVVRVPANISPGRPPTDGLNDSGR